jgi:hypothetical protein
MQLFPAMRMRPERARSDRAIGLEVKSDALWPVPLGRVSPFLFDGASLGHSPCRRLGGSGHPLRTYLTGGFIRTQHEPAKKGEPSRRTVSWPSQCTINQCLFSRKKASAIKSAFEVIFPDVLLTRCSERQAITKTDRCICHRGLRKLL